MPINLSPQSESGKEKELLTLICSILFSAFQLSQLIRGCSRCCCCCCCWLQIELELNLANHQKTRKTNVKRARHEQCIKIKKQRRRERERRASEWGRTKASQQSSCLVDCPRECRQQQNEVQWTLATRAGGEWQGKELQCGGEEAEGGGVATVAGICKGFTEAT